MAYDIIILGSGPAGLTAALYGARARKKVLILGGDTFAGQMAGIHSLENYPGFRGTGMELAEIMKKQATDAGAEIIFQTVKSIKDNEGAERRFAVSSAEGAEYLGKSVIIATGASPKKLAIAGAKEFAGRGVSYCATCDGFFYSDKTVVVYGGGNSALNDALYLANVCKKVKIIYRKAAFFRAEEILVERVKNTTNIECLFEREITEVLGDDNVDATAAGVTGIILSDGSKLATDALFVAIGHEANTDFLPEKYKRDNLGKIMPADESGTEIAPGLFVAGDVRSKNKMQICVATGWGCEAAMDSIVYLNKMGKPL